MSDAVIAPRYDRSLDKLTVAVIGAKEGINVVFAHSCSVWMIQKHINELVEFYTEH